MKTYICILLLLLSCFYLSAQICSINNASGCICKDGTSDCDLLPNIKVSKDLLLDQTSNFESPGKYELSVSTPNVGHGPLRVNATNYFLCGTDTIYSTTPLQNCANGHIPKQLVEQIIYHKNANGTMSSTSRFAGSMTYHPSHGHMHFDDWGIFTIRTEDPNDPNPLNWPIVGDGSKIGFCLMDIGSCAYFNGHCRDDNDNILTTNSPNLGLGGGSYTCGITNQGISCGYTDIYDYSLDGMFINIPPGVCNGTYKLVVHVDPNNVLVEENDLDNVQVIDITLTQQTGSNSGATQIDFASNLICNNTPVVLSVPNIGGNYIWSNASTTNTISVTTPGYYSCVITTSCGILHSDTIHVLKVNTAAPILTPPNPICSGESATLNASVSIGTVNWYDNINAQVPIYTGTSFTTPNLFWGTVYYAENSIVGAPQKSFSEPHSHIGNDLFNSNSINGEIWFQTTKTITLKSVKVYTDIPGERTVELQTNNGNIVQSQTVNIPSGISRIILNFSIPTGNWILTTNSAKNTQVLGYSSPRLQRTTLPNIYPTGIINALSINTSNYGNNYYYYFYDWEVEVEPFPCTSNRTQVTVNVIQAKDPSFTFPDASYCENSTGILPDFISTSGGQFSANNNLIINPVTGEIDGNTFTVLNSPYTIYYEVTANNCTSIDSVLLVAVICTNNNNLLVSNQFKVFPNPSNGIFTVAVPDGLTNDIVLELFDIQGITIDRNSIPSGNVLQSLNYSDLAEGVYFVRFMLNTEIVTKKVLIAK